MLRLIAPALLSLFLLSAPVPAEAQAVVPKAYAPEDLRQLNETDRIRVISLEYQDQSGGREIPDDQLEFYLDQVRSGWTFSRIKEDIATSLRGGGRPGNGPRPGNGNGGWNNGNRPDNRGAIRCESIDERPRECRTDFRDRAVVVRNLSRTQCVEGRNWGQRPGLIWVNWGCRAEFAESGGGNWQDSEYGRYSVTCASFNERYTTCAWNSRYGTPRLIERTSRAECIEGRSWGYRNGSLWVDRGCRARFAPGDRRW